MNELCDKHKSELKEAIKKVHAMYYDGSFLDNLEKTLEWHRALEVLFNYAKIESSTVENNPDEVSPSDFEKGFIINYSEGGKVYRK